MLEVQAENLRTAAAACYNAGRQPLAAICGADASLQGGGLVLYCFFYNLAQRGLDVVKAVFAAGATVYPSLTPVLPLAACYERELHEFFGFLPEGHPDLRPLLLQGGAVQYCPPLLKKPLRCGTNGQEPAAQPEVAAATTPAGQAVEQGQNAAAPTYTLSLGPLPEGIDEPAAYQLTCQGERILRAEAQLFFSHRGIEKAAEGKTPEAALLLAERICGACTVANSLSYCQALEKLSANAVPRRAWLIRTLAAELERLSNHLGDSGAIAAGAGLAAAVGMAARLQEYLRQLNEVLAGNRYLRGLIIPGGVSSDVSEIILEEIGEVLDEVEQEFNVLVQLCARRGTLQARIRGRGVISAAVATRLGMLGPAARASGSTYDSRRALGYGLYDELNFNVVSQESGDVAARLQVRFAEVYESLKIIRQVLRLLYKDNSQLLHSDLGELRRLAGSWGIAEGARGEVFCWLMLDAEGKLERLYFRAAAFHNWQAVPLALQGELVSDFQLIKNSFGLCHACLAR